MTVTKRQLRDLNAAIAHIGRAMRALDRAELDDSDVGKHTFTLRRGSQRLQSASNHLIRAAEWLHGVTRLYEVRYEGLAVGRWHAVDVDDAISQQMEWEREQDGVVGEHLGWYHASEIEEDS